MIPGTSGDDSCLSLPRTGSVESLLSLPLASLSGPLYIEIVFLLRSCMNQSIRYLRLYRSLYSNKKTQRKPLSPKKLRTTTLHTGSIKRLGKRATKGIGVTRDQVRRRSNATRRRMMQPRGSTPSWLKNFSRITIASHVVNRTITGSNAGGQLLRYPLVWWPATSAVSLTLHLRRKREKNPSIMPSVLRSWHVGSKEMILLSHADTRDVS